MSEKTVQVKTLTDRKVSLQCEGVSHVAEALLSIENVATYPSQEQFAYVAKEDLLDALVQVGWLPDEYRKPGAIDPREAKIREVTVLLYNSDNTDTPPRSHDQIAGWVLADYRKNAEDLIDAGLVKVDAA